MSERQALTERDRCMAQINALLAKKDFSKQDSARCDVLLRMADASGPEGMRLKRARLTQLALDSGAPRRDEYESDEAIEADFREYLIYGKGNIALEKRQQSITTDSAGGFLVPASFKDALDVALRAHDGIFEAAGTWQSRTGTAITIPIFDDISSTATIVAENAQSVDQDVAGFDGISFDKTPTWRSGMVRCSRELANDSYFDIAMKLADAFAQRFARGIGASMVSVLLAGADTGTTTGSPTAVATSELLDVMGSVDSAFWGASSWCMNKSTLISLLKLGIVSDAAGQAVTMWSAEPLKLFGKPVHICPSFPAIGASNTPISFGDHSKLLRREVIGSLSVKQFNERFAEYFQYGFEAMWRVDTAFLKASPYGSPAASQSPVKLIACHS